MVTSLDPEARPSGMTATAVSSVSLSPPLVLVCLETGTNTYRAVNESGVFAVNLLAREQAEVAKRFATDSERKFDGIRVTAGVTGAPLLEGVLAYCECSVVESVQAGDHTIFLGQVEAAESPESEDETPLVYYRGAYRTIADQDAAD